jgi:hypothetical protein
MISRGPGAGKTTVLLELARFGFIMRRRLQGRSSRSKFDQEAPRSRNGSPSLHLVALPLYRVFTKHTPA